jgi:hypothetical protein
VYFIILFLSPLYFLLRKKWGGFVANAILYVLAWLTILIFGLGIIFWGLAVGHAMWTYRTELMEQGAEIFAKKLAEISHEKER